MGFSPRTSQAMLDHVLGGNPMVPPTGLFVGLHTGDPEDGAPEITGQRAQVQFQSKGGVLQSVNPIEFPDLTATQAPVSHYAVYDHPMPGQGNRVFSEALTGRTRKMEGGETVAIPPGGLTVL